MTNEEAKAIIRKEYMCVDRDCDIERSCGRCDLMMPNKEPILQAYKMAMDALEQITKIADIVEGTIDHFDYDDAMDVLYEIKGVIKNDERTSQIRVNADIRVTVRGKETGA